MATPCLPSPSLLGFSRLCIISRRRRVGVAAQKIDFPARRPNHTCVPVTFEARGAYSDGAELAAKTLVLKGRRGPEVGSL